MPARLRYIAPHIKLTEKIASDAGLPFFILSGKYGLIRGDQEIPNYDYYLEESAVEDLIKLVTKQIRDNNTTEIDFYTKQKQTWAPYQNAIQKSSDFAGVLLNIHLLSVE